ncbi:MAG: molybdenum cofactor guanylyltransferase [Desulfobacterales bacterium]
MKRDGGNCGAVILSGGMNSRMGGRNKAFLEVGGKTILERLIETLATVFGDIVLVTRQPDFYRNFDVRIVEDIYRERSSLTGIHAGLRHSMSDHVFVAPCDAPFIQPALIRLLVSEIEPDIDVIVPELADHLEPLCAIYSKRCIPVIENQLDQGRLKIIDFFDQVRRKTIPIEKIRKADKDLRSFFNVNTPEVYNASRDLI